MIITIPTGTDSQINIPIKPKEQIAIERIGVSVKEAATMLGLCERTVWKLINNNKIKTIRIGRRVIVSVQSLRDFVNGTYPSP
jgi:excisionase family DNA binding protein